MPQPAVTTGLGASTLARKWKFDIDLSSAQDGSDYRRIRGVTDSTANPGTAGMQADSDHDSGGFTSSTATSMDWGASLTVRRATERGTIVYDAGQEAIRLKAQQMGDANTARIRMYEYGGPTGPKVEAYEGYVAVAYANGGGAFDALANATMTLTGQGALQPIAHPDTTVVAPVINGLQYVAGGVNTPAGGGGLIRISGVGLSTILATTAGLTCFGTAVPLTDRLIVSDNVIVFKAPAHAAGTGNVTATNTAGTSATATANAITYV